MNDTKQNVSGASAEAPSWEKLAGQLRPFVRRRVACDMDADDVVQEVLLRMHRGLADLRDESRLSAWMIRIARTAIVDHLRVRGREQKKREVIASFTSSESDEFDGGGIQTHHPSHESGMVDGEEEEIARNLAVSLLPMIQNLPEVYREAIMLTEFEGLTQKQAAEKLEISLSGMKSRVQRGRAQLRAMLERCCAIALDARGKIMSCRPRSPNSNSGSCNCC